MSNILAFDTSNYTTSACVLDTDKGIVWEGRVPVPVEEGKCGIRQSDAVFHHVRNLNGLFEGVPQVQIDAAAASDRPSERENSYMPCFTVGVSFARTVADLSGVPLYLCSHQKNHIAAALASVSKLQLLNEPFLAYHVSGGTTEILLCRPSDEVFSVERVGGTADISCGQLIDRVGNMLGFPFPSGKHIEKYAAGGFTGKARIKSHNGEYNFSGFENMFKRMISNSEPVEEICSGVLDTVYSFLIDSACLFRDKYGNIPIVFSGGVMSDKLICGQVSERLENVLFSLPAYSVDNATGTAWLCALKRGEINA